MRGVSVSHVWVLFSNKSSQHHFFIGWSQSVDTSKNSQVALKLKKNLFEISVLQVCGTVVENYNVNISSHNQSDVCKVTCSVKQSKNPFVMMSLTRQSFSVCKENLWEIVLFIMTLLNQGPALIRMDEC